MRKVFMVCAPESMGNKLISRLLRDSGCAVMGSLEDFVPKPRVPPGRKIVWGRSIPYNTLWVDPVQMAEYVQPAHVILITSSRNLEFTIQSQIRHRHVTSREEAIDNIKRARDIIARAAKKIPTYTVNYEELIANPREYWPMFTKQFGMPGRIREEIYDANAKYR